LTVDPKHARLQLLQLFRAELPALLHLALPLIAAELGWMAMSVVDTIMVGRLPHSAVAMAGAALSQVCFNVLAFATGGCLLGLDTLLSQAFGAKEIAVANRWFHHGLALALALAAALTGLLLLTPMLLLRLPVDPDILVIAVPALRGLIYGVLPLLVYFTLRRYLQAANHGRPIAFAMISANAINAAGDWLLLYGHHWGHHGRWLAFQFSIPAFGVLGSSWSTSFSRLYMMLVLLAALFLADRQHGYGLLRDIRGSLFRSKPAHSLERISSPERIISLERIHSLELEDSPDRMSSSKPMRFLNLAHLRQLFLLGAPAGAQIFVEIAIFALVTALIATFGARPLAGHEIALQCASTTFMVPFAISSATAVRVGRAIGRVRAGLGELPEVAAAGWTGILIGAVFMLFASALLLAIPARIAHIFTPDANVIAAAVPLLLIAAGFQFFDGIQITATGALRGAGNTTAPFYVQLVCFWAIGMPLGLLLGFHQHLGAAGLWWGLLTALTGAALVMLFFWNRTVKTLRVS
jgi:MATE family multidrug resistance protein